MLILISFFSPNYVKPLLTVNKCTTVMIIMSKVSWKIIFMGFKLTVVDNNRTFMKKSYFAYDYSNALQS